MQANAFIELVRRGEEELALEVLQAAPILAETRDPAGVSVVCLAVYRGLRALAPALAAARAELDVFEATCVGDCAAVLQLVDAQPELVNAVSPDGFTPAGYAAFFGHPEILRELIARGAEVDAPSLNAMRVRPIHSAAAHGHVDKAIELARLVLEAGADPNATQQGGFTALHEAARKGNLALIALLRKYGADLRLANAEGERAVDLARANAHPAAARMLDLDGN